MPALEGSKVLVIGGAGFVGSHLVDQLVAEPVREIIVLDNFVRGKRSNLDGALRDARVRVVEGSVMDLPLLERLMTGADMVFHLAALWLFECVHQPRQALEVNVGGTFNVIETAQKTGVKKIVYSSSASVYGDAVFTPMTEEHPFNNRTMYGATKIAGEQFLRAFYDRHKLNYVGLRYMNIYGPRMDDKGAYVSVIMKVLDRIERGERPLIFGDGSQAYDFVYVEDVARANILAMKSDATDDVFNVGMGVKTTINELVKDLLSLTGSTLQPEYRKDEAMFVTHRVGSTEKAERLLGFRARTPLREGLSRTVKWHAQSGRGRAVQDVGTNASSGTNAPSGTSASTGAFAGAGPGATTGTGASAGVKAATVATARAHLAAGEMPQGSGLVHVAAGGRTHPAPAVRDQRPVASTGRDMVRRGRGRRRTA